MDKIFNVVYIVVVYVFSIQEKQTISRGLIILNDMLGVCPGKPGHFTKLTDQANGVGSREYGGS